MGLFILVGLGSRRKIGDDCHQQRPDASVHASLTSIIAICLWLWSVYLFIAELYACACYVRAPACFGRRATLDGRQSSNAHNMRDACHPILERLGIFIYFLLYFIHILGFYFGLRPAVPFHFSPYRHRYRLPHLSLLSAAAAVLRRTNGEICVGCVNEYKVVYHHIFLLFSPSPPQARTHHALATFSLCVVFAFFWPFPTACYARARARAHNLRYRARVSAQVKHHAVHQSPADQQASRSRAGGRAA
jgi:hypothetical protein